jgi:hypothetical protein
MAFVPQDWRGERIPCRHISFDVEGYTIDTYSKPTRYADFQFFLCAQASSVKKFGDPLTFSTLSA